MIIQRISQAFLIGLGIVYLILPFLASFEIVTTAERLSGLFFAQLVTFFILGLFLHIVLALIIILIVGGIGVALES